MDDALLTFNRARLDDREALALAASSPEERPAGAEWTRECLHGDDRTPIGGWPCRECSEVVGMSIRLYDEGTHDAAQALHIAANDPRSTLHDVAAKRWIIDACENVGRYGEPAPGAVALADNVLRQLALPHAHHVDFRAEWRPLP